MHKKISNLKATLNQLQTKYNLVDDNQGMAYISTYPEYEHEMFGEADFESEGTTKSI